MQNTYRLPTGHEFRESPLNPVTIYTESDVDYVDPGKLATDSNGHRFQIIEVRHVGGRLYRVTMIPQEVGA